MSKQPEQPKIWVKVVEAHAVRTWVAVILTFFAGLSLFALTAGAVWNTVANPEVTDLSANFMTVISGALGVIFGGLSGFLGNQALQDKATGEMVAGDENMTLHIQPPEETNGPNPPAAP